MNERIRELVEQAGAVYSNDHAVSLLDDEIEKFAELIVKECLTLADTIRDGCEADGEDEQALGADWVGLAIARHFGVEE
jgi:hypothetical protein